MARLDRNLEKGASAPFLLVLADADDRTALAVLRQLHRWQVSVRHVTPAEVLMAPVFCHDPCGESSVTLANGLTLGEATLVGVLNRVRFCLPLQFMAAKRADQIYASEEAFALLVSWLTALRCPVTNRPHPGCVAGWAPLGPVEDRLQLAAGNSPFVAASRARYVGPLAQIAPWPHNPLSELPQAPKEAMAASPAVNRMQGDTSRIFIAGQQAIGPDIPADVMRRIRATLAARRLEIASVSCLATPNGHDIVGVDPLPDATGPEEVVALARHLGRVAGIPLEVS